MKTPVGTTFVVAASLLGAVAVVQLVAILVYFGPGFAVVRPEAVVVAPLPTPVPAEPEASPAPPAETAEMAAQKVRLEELMREVETLEQGPSPDAALVPLEEAASLQPRNPDVLSRLASLHEKLGQIELAQGLGRVCSTSVRTRDDSSR